MLFDAQDPARPQGRIGVREGLFGQPRRHPSVDVAHEQDQIDGSGGRHRPGRRAEGGELHRPIQLLVGQNAGLQGVVDRDLGRFRRRPFGEARQVEGSAALVQIGGQDLDVPAAAGPEVDHRHLRLQAEEAQGLDRMTPDIARLVRRRTPGTGHGPFQRAFRRPGGRGGGLRRRRLFFLLAAGGQTGEGGHAGARQNRASRRTLSHARLPGSGSSWPWA
ncbi:hypothetical protein D3C80_1026830 [compost metagenome]